MPITVLVRSTTSGEARLTFDGMQSIVLGRGASCDVRLPDPSVSHRHASLRAQGMLADEDGFAAAFEGAISLHERTPDAFEAARTRLAFGQRLRRSRNRVLAREQLRTAVDDFDGLGARPWADRARAELAATGETHRRRDGASIDDLTPQELQVALLLTSGKTTRETAAALFLSPKTVEYHLRHVYQRLGIHSREELTERLGRPGGPNG